MDGCTQKIEYYIIRTINLKAVTRAVGSINLEDAVAPTSEEDADFRFYHNTGVAMFEDNWPKQSNGPDNDLKGCTIVYSLCTFLHFIHSKKE